MKINLRLKDLQQAKLCVVAIYADDRMGNASYNMLLKVLNRARRAEMALEALNLTLGSD